MAIFHEPRHQTLKMNITFSMGSGVPNTVLKFFLKKAHTGPTKPEKPVVGHIFPHISDSIGSIISKNYRNHPCVNLHQPCEFHENRCQTATCIVTVIIIINWKSKSVIFECKLKNIHEVLLFESVLIRKKISRRINFVLIKFSLNALLFEKSWNKRKNP